jgi:predicted Fe-Mo cluster-binding NifX family protein
VEEEMKIAVASMGTSLDAWAGASFGICSQFVVVETETMESIVISVPPEQQDPSRVSLYAIRALAAQGVEAVICGRIKGVCREALTALGAEVVEGVERMTVRQAVETYQAHGARALAAYEPPPIRIAVASHGADLEATLSQRGEPCTSFVLVDPQTMHAEVVEVQQGETQVQTSVNAVRAAARHGAAIVITPEIRPACCTALRALSIGVALADPQLTVRQAIEAYQRGELETPPYL